MIFIHREPPLSDLPMLIVMNHTAAKFHSNRLKDQARKAAQEKNWPGYSMYRGTAEKSTWVKLLTEIKRDNEWRKIV